MEAIFAQLDVDGDGTLTRDEVVKNCHVLKLSEEEAHQLFDKLDVDGDGELGIQEFAKAAKLLSYKKKAQDILRQRSFRANDANQSTVPPSTAVPPGISLPTAAAADKTPLAEPDTPAVTIWPKAQAAAAPSDVVPVAPAVLLLYGSYTDGTQLERIAEAEAVLAKYAGGREGRMWAMLGSKFEAAAVVEARSQAAAGQRAAAVAVAEAATLKEKGKPPGSLPLFHRTKILALYGAVNPTKINEADGILAKRKGVEEDMWDALSKKYGAAAVAAADAITVGLVEPSVPSSLTENDKAPAAPSSIKPSKQVEVVSTTPKNPSGGIRLPPSGRGRGQIFLPRPGVQAQATTQPEKVGEPGGITSEDSSDLHVNIEVIRETEEKPTERQQRQQIAVRNEDFTEDANENDDRDDSPVVAGDVDFTKDANKDDYRDDSPVLAGDVEMDLDGDGDGNFRPPQVLAKKAEIPPKKSPPPLLRPSSSRTSNQRKGKEVDDAVEKLSAGTGMALKFDGDPQVEMPSKDKEGSPPGIPNVASNFNLGLFGTMLPIGSLSPGRGFVSPRAGIKAVLGSSNPRSTGESPQEPPSPVDRFASKPTSSPTRKKSVSILQDAAAKRPIMLTSVGALERNDGSRPCYVKIWQKALDDADDEQVQVETAQLVCTFFKERGVENLIGIDLTACEIKGTVPESLAQVLALGTNLSSLKLTGNSLGHGGARSIVKALVASKITVLSLGWNDIGTRGAISIAEYIKGTSVMALNLEGNAIGDSGAKAIAEALPATSLVSLNLCENGLGNNACIDLSSSLPGSSLKILLMGENNIGFEGAQALAKFLSFSNVTELDLSANNFGAKATQTLAAALAASKVTSLNLSENQIGDLGAHALADALPSSPLIRLGLVRNNIGDDGLAEVLLATRALPPNQRVFIDMNQSEKNPLVHGDTSHGWAVPANLPRPDHFALSLLGLNGGQFAAARWIVVLLCMFAFFLPGFLESDATSDVPQNTKHDAIVTELEGVCDKEDVLHLRGAFVDPYFALFTVVLLMIFARLYEFSRQVIAEHGTPVAKRYVATRHPDLFLSLFTTPNDFAEVKGAPKPFDVNHSSSKTTRSFFLFLHTLILFFVMGDFFVFSAEDAPKEGSSALCRVARVTVVMFYKPFIVSALCCYRFMSDAGGTLLFHNPLTDSIVAVLIVLLLVWVGISFLFSFPVLVVFFFFGLCFFVPVGLYIVSVNLPAVAGGGSAAGKARQALEAKELPFQVIKQLLGLSTFCALVFGVSLWPFYEGEGYAHVTERVGAAIATGLHVWKPSWRLVFAWPRGSSALSQAALAVALAAVAFEAAQALWSLILYHAYPFGWDLGPRVERVDVENNDKNDPDGKMEVDLDAVVTTGLDSDASLTTPASKQRRRQTVTLGTKV